MNRKRKIGILLVLIGIGIPLVLYSFQDRRGNVVVRRNVYEEKLVKKDITPQRIKDIRELAIEILKEYYEEDGTPITEEEKRKLEETREKERKYEYKTENVLVRKGIYVAYRLPLGFGIILTLIGIGLVLFSFIPKEAKSQGDKGE